MPHMLKRFLILVLIAASLSLLTLIAPSGQAQGGDICFRATFTAQNHRGNDITFQFEISHWVTGRAPGGNPLFTQEFSLAVDEVQTFTLSGRFPTPLHPGTYYTAVHDTSGFGIPFTSQISFIHSPCETPAVDIFCLLADVTVNNQTPNYAQGVISVLISATVSGPFGPMTVMTSVASFRLQPVPPETSALRSVNAQIQIPGFDLSQPYEITVNHTDIPGMSIFLTLNTASLIRCDGTEGPLPPSAPRLNREAPAAPVAVFVVDEALHFYAINPTTAQGYLAFTTTFEEMRAASQEAVSSGEHVLIREQFNVALYALSSGECQVNGFYSDGNLYEFIFPCP